MLFLYYLGPWLNVTDLIDFKLHRFNRLQRLYENVWLWKDINIGPHGHFIFNLPVPERPALWMVSSFGISTKAGFGLLRSPIIVSFVDFVCNNVSLELLNLIPVLHTVLWCPTSFHER